MELAGKVVLITGAAQGIGAEMGRGFAQRGAKVALSDIADPSAAVTSVHEIGGEALGVQADVSLEAECQRMVDETVAAFGRLDGLVCNAALFAALPSEAYDEISVESWDRVMAVNVRGPWLCSRAAVPAMEKSGGGAILMIGTNRIFQGFPGLLHYDASKGAVQAMTRSLAREVGDKNIRVNTLAPGLTMSEGVLKREGIKERAPAIAKGRALARDQQPEDLVGTAAFFLSDNSGFVSGQSLIVDGGGIVR